MTQKELLDVIEKAVRDEETSLDLSSSELTSLPAEIGQLTALTQLNLWNNHLTSLPAEIGQLTALTAPPEQSPDEPASRDWTADGADTA